MHAIWVKLSKGAFTTCDDAGRSCHVLTWRVEHRGQGNLRSISCFVVWWYATIDGRLAVFSNHRLWLLLDRWTSALFFFFEIFKCKVSAVCGGNCVFFWAFASPKPCNSTNHLTIFARFPHCQRHWSNNSPKEVGQRLPGLDFAGIHRGGECLPWSCQLISSRGFNCKI